ncbi:MAG TPA: Gldg family protein [Gammaproteobacteria bacterium]|nr:Gldg family protein [Gammaproteobacteria bacterium]
MSTAQRSRIGYSTLVLLALVFVAAVMVSNMLLKGLRIDLTENQLYTLAPGTKKLLANLAEPVNLYLFFSDEETKNIPFLRSYEGRVREMLDEFAGSSRGKLKVEVVDPQPFSEEEDRANQFGLEPVNLGTVGQNIFFGVAGTNSVGDQQKIPFLQPDKEAFLEYDLARLVYSLAHPKKPVVGLLAGVQMSGGFDPAAQQARPPWTITQQVRQLFELRPLPTSFAKVDDDVDVLWLVHPRNLDDKTLFAIDQFVLRGGRALIFVDPLAEIAAASGDPSGLGGGASSDLKRLFDAWGLEYSADTVVGDNVHALSINSGYGRRPVRHLGLIGLDKQSMDQKDVITAGLESVNLGTAGHLAKASKAKFTLTPLITSSAEAALLPVSKLQFLADPSQLLDDFHPSGETYTLAARIEGHLDTAFPDGPPEASSSDAAKGDAAKGDAEKGGDAKGDAAKSAAASGDPAPEAGDKAGGSDAKPSDAATKASGTSLRSTDKANVVVVADVDVLSDRMWVQKQSFLGQDLVTAFASNGDLVTNALDNLSGSADLIGLRSRATFSRPFTTVDALRRDADARFRATEQELQAELTETQKKLNELQSARNDKTSLIMSPEQQQELQRFRDRQIEIRRQLRDVQHNLDQSIEALGTRLKVINILVMPIALILFAVLAVYVKRRRAGGVQ